MKEEERKRILNKLNEMINYVDELKEMLPSKKEYLDNLIKRRACEKTIEIAIETMIDVAALIVSAEKIGFPTGEENIFDLLYKNKILDREICEKAKKMKGFRNILIHRYTDVDDEIVYENLKNSLNDFYYFVDKIKEYLKKIKNF
ncbi:MAG: DUF86 domain-containing protein [Candidatus Thermoplasmatota archaeon]